MGTRNTTIVSTEKLRRDNMFVKSGPVPYYLFYIVKETDSILPWGALLMDRVNMKPLNERCKCQNIPMYRLLKLPNLPRPVPNLPMPNSRMQNLPNQCQIYQDSFTIYIINHELAWQWAGKKKNISPHQQMTWIQKKNLNNKSTVPKVTQMRWVCCLIQQKSVKPMNEVDVVRNPTEVCWFLVDLVNIF